MQKHESKEENDDSGYAEEGGQSDLKEVRKGSLQQTRKGNAEEVREGSLCGAGEEVAQSSDGKEDYDVDEECEYCGGSGELATDVFDGDSHQWMMGVGRVRCVCTYEERTEPEDAID